MLVLEKEQFGGQITITHEVVNYSGLAKISGKELTETMRRQAESFGAEFLMTEAESLKTDGDVKTVHPRPHVTRTTEFNNASETAKSIDDSGEIFTAEMKEQLEEVFSKMERSLVLKLYLDNRPLSLEL